MLHDPRLVVVQGVQDGAGVADVVARAAAGHLLSFDDFATQLHHAAARVLVQEDGG